MPVYVALGNNDTACDGLPARCWSDFLVQTGRMVVEGLPRSQRQQARKCCRGRYYSLTMGPPMRDTRLIVVNDIFLSAQVQHLCWSTRLRGDHHGDDLVTKTNWHRRDDWVKRFGSWATSRRAFDPYSTVAEFKEYLRERVA